VGRGKTRDLTFLRFTHFCDILTSSGALNVRAEISEGEIMERAEFQPHRLNSLEMSGGKSEYLEKTKHDCTLEAKYPS
jgi:hypothetical protein